MLIVLYILWTVSERSTCSLLQVCYYRLYSIESILISGKYFFCYLRKHRDKKVSSNIYVYNLICFPFPLNCRANYVDINSERPFVPDSILSDVQPALFYLQCCYYVDYHHFIHDLCFMPALYTLHKYIHYV